jgi:AcrR family transcriptional regulator
VHVTSLYNHVPDKEAVLDGIVERLLGEALLPRGTVTWDEWIRRFATAMRRIARRHPGAFAAFHQRPVQGPRAAEWTEAGLAAFRDAGFSLPDACRAIKSASLAVLGLVLDDLARGRAPDLATDLSALPRERYPLLHDASAIASGLDTWSYLLDALVKGFGANLRESTAGRRAAGRRARARTGR